MRAPELKTPPAELAVSVNSAKSYLSLLDEDDWDTDIQAMIEGATAVLDGVQGLLGLALSPQTWVQYEYEFGTLIPLCLNNPTEIVSVKYTDQDGIQQVIDPSNYEYYKASNGAVLSFLLGITLPPRNLNHPLEIEFKAGFVVIPSALKHAIKMLVLEMFDGRGNANQDLKVVKSSLFKELIKPFRIARI